MSPPASNRRALIHKAAAFIVLALALALLGSAGYRIAQAVAKSDALALAMVESGAGKQLFYGLLLLAGYLQLAFGIFNRLAAKLTRDVWMNLALVGASVVAGLLLMELALRPFGVVFSAANQVVEAKISDDGKRMVWARPHERIGYVPIDGRGRFGERSGPDAPPSPNVRRVLFAGDSIAETRFLEQAVRAQMPPGAPVQFWNTGVSGYSTVQERLYFEEFGRGIKPDLMILEFCLNDFDGTPVVFKDEKEGFVVLIPQMGRDEYNQWLFLNSTLYRFYLTLKKWLFIDPRGRPGRMADMKANLARFKAIAAEDGFRFKVVVYPTLDARANWTENDVNHHRAILDILRELGIEAYDLAPLLDEALAKHPATWARLFEKDKIHPSKDFAAMAATYLIGKGLMK